MPITQASPNGVMNSAVPFPQWVDAIVLGSASAESYTVPAGAGYAVITCNAPVWACISGTATIPAADTTDGTSSFYLAAGMQCKLGSGKTLSVIRASGAAIVSIGVYHA